MRVPYAAGDRTPSGAGRAGRRHHASTTSRCTGRRRSTWPTTARSTWATAATRARPALTPHPFHGGILQDSTAPQGGTPVAQGFRNPIAVRCARGHNPASRSSSRSTTARRRGGREKLVPIRQGDDWGFPCCATTNLPYAGRRRAGARLLQRRAGDGLVPHRRHAVRPRLRARPLAGAVDGRGARHDARRGRLVDGRAHRRDRDRPDHGAALAGQRPRRGRRQRRAWLDFATGWDDGTFDARAPRRGELLARRAALRRRTTRNGDIFWIAPVAMAMPMTGAESDQ